MMRVLVLGADGFVGRGTVAALAASDWATPVAGSRRAAGEGERIVLDATDAAQLAGAIGRVDAVVNCIAGDDDTITRNAAALFAASDGRRVVHLSSMAVYGGATGMIDEHAPLAGTGNYAGAKVAAERSAAGVANVVILRPGCIYGPGSTQWSLRIARLLAHRRVGDLGADGEGCSNIVHVDDVVAAILAGLRDDAAAGQAFNLAMADAPDWNGYFLAFARALGTVPIRRIPGWQLKLEKLAAIPLKIAEKASPNLPPAIPPSLLRLFRQDIRLDPSAAEKMLGLAWTPLADGVAQAAGWCGSRRRTRP